MGKILLIIVLICATILVLVYWNKYRPEAVKQMCLEEQQVVPVKRPGEKFQRRVRSYYDCLRENGLAK